MTHRGSQSEVGRQRPPLVAGHTTDLDEPAVNPVLDRVVAAVTVLAATTVVVLLARVTPDPRGYGTHEQLGLVPCGWPASAHLPCPTCGCTTAAAWLVHLSPLRALQAQPFGAVLAAAGIALGLLALWCLVRRQSFVERIAMLPYGTLLAWTLVLFAASWLYKYLTFSP